MKKLLVLAFAFAGLTAGAQTFPAPSLAAKTYQVVGVTPMEISYSSPAARDRVIFGELVPYGQLWRTGANGATVLSSEETFFIDGKDVKPGKYAVFTIPAKDEVTFILNSNTEQGGTGDYDQSLDVARITVPFTRSEIAAERMMFTFENTTTNSTDLTFRWYDRKFVVPITVNTDKIVEARAAEKIKSGDVDFGFYNGAANYYLETGNAKKAVEMAEKSTAMDKKFYNMYTLAKAYQAAGKIDKAREAAEMSLKMSNDAKYQHYINLNQKLLQEL